MNRINLNDGWMMHYEALECGPEQAPIIQMVEKGWLEAELPCDIHTPLIKNGIIREPLEADYSYECEWTEEKSWWFKKVFIMDDEYSGNDVLELTIESLDGEADIFINGMFIGHHISAFYPFRLDVKKYVHTGENTILIRLSSGLEHVSGKDLSGLKQAITTETSVKRGERGDQRRVFVRKPQYAFGWDWGPRVATCGIVKNVYIEALNKIAIRSVHAVNRSLDNNAVIGFEIEVENLQPYSTLDAVIKIDIFYDNAIVKSCKIDTLLKSGINFLDEAMIIENPRLWWPNGMGEQPLYSVRISADCEGCQTEFKSFKHGIKSIKLCQQKINSNEREFSFEVNGIKVFCKGGSWIPADSIYARVSDDKYNTLLHEAKEANFNMLRIWGGGIYERDIFYDKCDEYGIMVWHDFMFACAAYPDNMEWFCKEVGNEVDYQVKRLRNHTSIVLWCGNNENHWAFDEWWVNKEKPSFMGGIKCYNDIIPSIVRKNSRNIEYWNSSPYGGKHPNGNDMGDRHHWHDCMMSDDMEKRITPEEYDKVNAKFVSEYGYLGPIGLSSMLKYHGNNPVDLNGHIWKVHTNTLEQYSKTVDAGIAKHYKDIDGMSTESYLLYAGLCQGMMLGYSLESLRFKLNCSGGLFWMYNDCWGELGWSIIDYYLTRKISYYFVKRAFAPVKFILREENGTVMVAGINETSENLSFDTEYGYVGFCGNDRASHTVKISLKPFSREVVFSFKKGEHDFTRGICYVLPLTDEITVLPAVLREKSFRELDMPKATLKLSNIEFSGKNARFKVFSNTYAHAVHFNFSDEVRLSDNYFDLMPGETREVEIYDAVEKLCDRSIIVKCVNS